MSFTSREPLGHLARLGEQDLGNFCRNAPLVAGVAAAREAAQEILAARPEPERAIVAALRAEIRWKVEGILTLLDDYWIGAAEVDDAADAVWSEMLARRWAIELAAPALETLAAPWRIIAARPVAADWAGPNTPAVEAIIEAAARVDRERAVDLAAARATVVGLVDADAAIRGWKLALFERLIADKRAGAGNEDASWKALIEARDWDGEPLVSAERRASGVHGGRVAHSAVWYTLMEPGTAPNASGFVTESEAASAASDAAMAAACADLIPAEIGDRLSAAWWAGPPAPAGHR